MIQLEARPAPSRLMSVLAPVAALLLTMAIGAILFSAMGKDPLRVLELFVVEPFSSLRSLADVGAKATTLVLCSVGLALCFRSNIWNIGAEGQYLMGAVTGGGLAMLVTMSGSAMSPWAFFPMAVVAGAIGGGAWAAIVAWLRDRFSANEILVSLMLVYIADLFVKWLVFGPWKDPKGYNFPQTITFASNTVVPRVFGRPYALHWGVGVALLAAVALWLYMFRTYSGMQLQIGGPAPAAARYAGFSSRAAIWTTLLVSGSLSGVAGALEATGPMNQITPHMSQGYGFTAIIVAFMGRLHPLGCVLGSVLLSAFVIGGEMAQSRAQLPAALSQVVQGVLLFALLGWDTFINHRLRWRRTP